MRSMVLRRALAAVMLVVMLLSIASPAWADSWTNIGQHQPPMSYQNSDIQYYTRGQYEDFYVNYNGYNQTADGAAHAGSQYPVDIWDKVVGEDRYGYAALSSSEFNTASGDVQSFLHGFQFMQDADPNSNSGGSDYLIDYDYLSSVAPPVPSDIDGQQIISQPTFISSGNIHDNPIPITVTPTGQTSYGPSAPGGNDVNNVTCVNNTTAANGFTGEAWFPATPADGSGNYTWKQATVSAAPGNGPEPVNLTQSQANYYMYNGIGSSLSSNPDYPTPNFPDRTWRGRCGVSFPYNIFVGDVKKTSQNSSNNTVTYDWDVINQTPLGIKNITVRVYTLGENDGKWNLVQEYNNLDMPPVKRDLNTGVISGLANNPQNNTFPVVQNGIWTDMQGESVFTRPDESYDVIVTANVNLNLSNGQIGIPTCEPLDGMYDAGGIVGATPPGEPAGDTVDQVGYQTAQDNQELLGTSLPVGYNDNVAYCSDSSNPSPGPGPSPGPTPMPPTNGYNLEAVSLTSSPATSPTQLTFTFTNNLQFPEGGDTEVYFYIQSNTGYLTGYGDGTGPGGSYIVHITPGGTGAVTVSNSQVPFQVGDTVWASVDATSADGVNWSPIEFQGDDGQKYNETTYDDNYLATVIQGNSPQPFVPVTPDMHPTTYPILDHTITWNTVTTPIIGWQEENIVIPTPPKVRVRLIQ